MKNKLTILLYLLPLYLVMVHSTSGQFFSDTAEWAGGSGTFGGEWSESGFAGWALPGTGISLSWSDTSNPVTSPDTRIAIFGSDFGGGPVDVIGTVNVSRIELQGFYDIQSGTIDLISDTRNEIIVGTTDGGGFSVFAEPTISSSLTGSNGLTISSGFRDGRFGTAITFSGVGSYTGETDIQDTNVIYDFTNVGNRLDPNSDLLLREATVAFTNGGPDNASQNVTNLSLGGGVSGLAVEAYDVGDMKFKFGGLARTELGAAIIVQQLSPGGVETDDTNTNGLLHPSVILKDGTTYDWASVSGTERLEAAAYSADDFTGTTNNVDLTTGISLSDDTTVNSLRIGSTAGAESVTVASGKTLTLSSGGLMQSADVGGKTTIDGGSLTSPAQELMVFNFSDSHELQIDSAITGSGLNVSFLSDPDIGSAAIGLGGQNTFDGVMTINSASVRLDSGAQLNTGDLRMNGFSTLTLNESATVGGLQQEVNATVTIGAGKTLNINENSPGNLSSSATQIYGTINGDGVLRKSGLGRAAILNGANVTTDIEVTGGDLRANPGQLGTINVSGAGRLVTFAGLGATLGDITLDGGTLWIGASTELDGVLWNSGKVKGAGTLLGTYDISSGKILAPGESPGTTQFEAQTWSGGGSYEWEVTDVEGTAGADPGWDLVQINQGAAGTQTLTITADDQNPFTISVLSLSDAESEGATTNWDDTQTYAWVIAEAVDGISGFSEDAFVVDSSQFESFNSFGSGSFFVSLENGDSELWLNYTPVPEPAQAGLLLGLGVLILLGKRRRRARNL